MPHGVSNPRSQKLSGQDLRLRRRKPESFPTLNSSVMMVQWLGILLRDTEVAIQFGYWWLPSTLTDVSMDFLHKCLRIVNSNRLISHCCFTIFTSHSTTEAHR
jgi:hypothetical protein